MNLDNDIRNPADTNCNHNVINKINNHSSNFYYLDKEELRKYDIINSTDIEEDEYKNKNDIEVDDNKDFSLN